MRFAKPPGGFLMGDAVGVSGEVLVDEGPREADFPGSSEIFPAINGPLLSTVVTFFSFVPFCI